VLIDRGGTPGVTDEILRDRHNIANDGLVIVTLAIDMEQGEFVGDPVIQAKGFHGPDRLLDLAFDTLQDALRQLSKEEVRDLARVRHDTQDLIKRYINKRCNLRPMVLPTIIEV
jgi:ribonuclease J